MRADIIGILECPACRHNSFNLDIREKDGLEIRQGSIVCNNCRVDYGIQDGIIDFLRDPSNEVGGEIEAVRKEKYLRDESGNYYGTNKESIDRFKEQFLLLPEGNDSSYFREGGCFQSITETSHRFYDTLDKMRIRPGMQVLSLGDGFGYASYKFAKLGARAIAVDITKYLLASDIYVKSAYFDRVFSDMHSLPFMDESFDIIFCSAVLHHSKNLSKAFLEIKRLLKKGGKVFVINESSRGVFEKVDPSFEDLNKRGFSDTSYTIPEWARSARDVGFSKVSIEFLSMADDYIARREKRKNNHGAMLKFAYFLRRHRALERFLLILLKYPRLLFRPRSWRMVCVN